MRCKFNGFCYEQQFETGNQVYFRNLFLISAAASPPNLLAPALPLRLREIENGLPQPIYFLVVDRDCTDFAADDQ